MSQYSNIPGVNLNIKDGQLGITQDNTSNSLLIVSEAKVPSIITVPEEPVLIRNEDELKETFGDFFYKGELNPIAAEWAIAKRGGIRNVYLMAIKGTTSKEKIVDLQDKLFNVVPDLNIEQIAVTSLYADVDITGLQAVDFGVSDLSEVSGIEAYYTRTATTSATSLAVVEGTPVTLTITSGENSMVITVAASKTAVELVSLLNAECASAAYELGIDIEVKFSLEAGKAVMQSTKSVTIAGTQILAALGLTAITESLQGVANAGSILGSFAERYSAEAQAIIAHIGVAPIASTNLTDINSHVNALVARTNAINKYVQVVAGPAVGVIFPGSLQTQWTSGVTQYATLVNSLPAQIATTNRALPQAAALRYNLSLRQIDKLSGNRYVTYRIKNNRIIVVDGVTSAPDLYVGQDVVKSDFTRLSTLRTTNRFVMKMRDALDAFIGQPNEFSSYNAMNTAIKGVIKDEIQNGVIQDATYSIRLGETLDASVVDLVVLPQFELRKIELSVGLSTPANF